MARPGSQPSGAASRDSLLRALRLSNASADTVDLSIGEPRPLKNHRKVPAGADHALLLGHELHPKPAGTRTGPAEKPPGRY